MGCHTRSSAFLYGFVLFRQQRDESRSRGYFQKALVLVSERPYVDLYDRVLRVAGPLFFSVGAQVLRAVYDGIHSWCVVLCESFQLYCECVYVWVSIH